MSELETPAEKHQNQQGNINVVPTAVQFYDKILQDKQNLL